MSVKYTSAVVRKQLLYYTLQVGMHNNETGDVYKTCKRASENNIVVITCRVLGTYLQ